MKLLDLLKKSSGNMAVARNVGRNMKLLSYFIKLLTSNVNYSGCTAPLTSKVAFYIFIQQI